MSAVASLFCYLLIVAWFFCVYLFLFSLAHGDLMQALIWMAIYGAVIPILFWHSKNIAEG